MPRPHLGRQPVGGFGEEDQEDPQHQLPRQEEADAQAALQGDQRHQGKQKQAGDEDDADGHGGRGGREWGKEAPWA